MAEPTEEDMKQVMDNLGNIGRPEIEIILERAARKLSEDFAKSIFCDNGNLSGQWRLNKIEKFDGGRVIRNAIT